MPAASLRESLHGRSPASLGSSAPALLRDNERFPRGEGGGTWLKGVCAAAAASGGLPEEGKEAVTDDF